MDTFRLASLSLFIANLKNLEKECECARDMFARGVSQQQCPTVEHIVKIRNALETGRDLCSKLDLTSAGNQIGMVQLHHGDHPAKSDYSCWAADLRNVESAVEADLFLRSVVQIDMELSQFVDNELLFGERVKQSFPKAIPDIRDAGNCLAVGLGTATVFHLMRAAEWGLRALCVHLGVTRIRKCKKPGTKKYIAISYSQWEQMLSAVQERIDARIDRLAPGKKKQSLQEYYYPLLRDLKGFKDAWRNHVMHARADYSVNSAKAVFGHVKNFMEQLSQRASESV